MHIVMLGTRGVPARYGGFETAVEEIGRRLAAKGHEITVFCRSGSLDEYEGMRLIHLPAPKFSSIETLSHTGLSVFHKSISSADVAFLFNAANAIFLPVLRRRGVPTAVHVDGLEWQRSKWKGGGRRFYQQSEKFAVRWADALIADAQGIEDYYLQVHEAKSHLISYGAPILERGRYERLKELDLAAGQYHLVVARLEPENHVHVAIEGFRRSGSQLPFVVVGDAPYSKNYVASVKAQGRSGTGVRMLGGVWDQDLLDTLYSGCASYVHGHSVGGTNPSLLRAMGAASPVLGYDVNFNREVLLDTGLYWSDADELAGLLDEVESDPAAHRERGLAGQRRASAAYNWDTVANQYEALAYELQQGRV